MGRSHGDEPLVATEAGGTSRPLRLYQTPLARCTEVNREGEPGYVRVRNGIFGMKSVLIPVQFVERDVKRKTLVLK